MPTTYLITTFLFAIVTGFAISSRGSFFVSQFGQLVQGVLSTVCLGFIGWSFWSHGWRTGFIELIAIFAGCRLGIAIFNIISRR